MFLLGSFILAGWIFCNFYYADLLPRSWSVYMMFAGLFSITLVQISLLSV